MSGSWPGGLGEVSQKEDPRASKLLVAWDTGLFLKCPLWLFNGE